MPVKLIVTDLDGTVFNEDNEILPEVTAAFQQAGQAGIPVVVATGRTETEARDAALLIGADHYIITVNGAYIYDYKRRRPLSHQHMPVDAVLSLLQYLQRFDRMYFQVYSDNKPYASRKSVAIVDQLEIPEGYKAHYHLTHVVLDDLAHAVRTGKIQVDKFFMASDQPQYFPQISAHARSIPGLRSLMSIEFGLEIVPQSVDKSFAIQQLCDHMGIDVADTLVIGDSENDLGMLDIGGISVAMGNAPAHVKSHADWIAPSNQYAGVAAAVRRFVLSPDAAKYELRHRASRSRSQ